MHDRFSGTRFRAAAGRAAVAVLGLALILPLAASAEPTDNWTQWGGPRANFMAPSEGVADSWGVYGPKLLWWRELGDGYSTILAEDGRLYTMYRSDDQEAVICLDAATGETIWEHRYDHDPQPGHVTQFGSGPRATPLIAGGRIFSIGVAGLMHSLDKESGRVVWAHDLWGEVFGGNKLNHGYSSSPIAYGDTVIALVGGEGKSIVAFNQHDGSVAWRSMSYQNSYASPQILEVDGQEQLVAFMAKELVGADPETGEELWRYPQENQFDQNINPPALVDGQYLFLSSLETGARGLKLTRSNGTTEVEELWSSRKVQFYHVTSVNEGEWVYGASGNQPAFMSAINVKTGEIPWRKRGIGKANAVYADGHVILLNEDGKLFLTTATPEDLTIHSEVELLDRVAWTAPTIVGNTMYVRDLAKIAALDLSAGASEKIAMKPAAPDAPAAPEAEAEMAEATEEAAEAEMEDSEAVKLLKKADAAIKAVTGVRYKGMAEPDGVVTNFISASEGEGIMVGWSDRRPEKFRVHVKSTKPGSDEALEVTGGGDGETFFLLDHVTKKAYQDIDPGVMGSNRNALFSIGLGEFVHPTPFDDEIGAETVELQGTETVAGVECHKVYVDYGGGRGQSTWYFSTEDLLPRRRVRHFDIPQQGKGTLVITLTELETDPEVADETFQLTLPEGYEKVDDFAP